jgi:uncharacterized protein Yka (UPF0111/DUF47 family)
MLEKLLPRSDEFFDAFDAQAQATVDGARTLHALLGNYTNVAVQVAAIKDAEHRGDRFAQASFERLHKQFITPFNRAEIHRLLSRIDDILDLADAAADRLVLYDVTTIPAPARELAGILLRAAQAMQGGVRLLREIKRPENLLAACREIKSLETEADGVFRAAVARLFKDGTDALTVIKWKDIYELIEDAVDRCEDVANVLESLVLQNA